MFLRNIVVLLVVLCEATYSLRAQVYFHFDSSIPVETTEGNQAMPWAGGLNSAQINTIDLNSDGKQDLAVFDRTANKVFTFLSVGNQYAYAPDYETFFPSAVSYWMLLRDVNCDGKKDLLTATLGGMAVFINTTGKGKNLSWRPFNKGAPLLTAGLSGTINIQMNATDIPAIDDVDEDGDLDVIVSRFNLEGSFEFHRNMSIENAGRCDSMQMKLITNTWGDMHECDCGSYAFNNKDCPGSARIQHDAGKTLLTIDLTNHGLHDFLFSEQSCNSLYFFRNDGAGENASFNSFSIFPTTQPSTILFPAAFFEDVDFDGVKDLTISTNVGPSVATAFDLSNSVLWYKNTGTSLSPQLTFQKSNFLQDQMIDVGSYSSPAFADYDGDGDADMFVSYWATSDTVASIVQYENNGTAVQPSFKKITNNFMNFSSLGLYNVKIQFVDINNDKKIDLAFTATDKKTFLTKLYYFSNEGVFSFSGNPSVINLPFTLAQYENIYLHDIDHDGLIDLLYGKADGSLQYYRNASAFNFVLNSSSYLGLSPNIERYCVSPAIADLQNDGKPDLILGSKGSIVVFQNFSSNKNVPDTVLLQNQLKNSYESKKLSSYLSMTTADLYATKNPLVIAGNITGGLSVLKMESTNENLISMYPNPVGQQQKLFFQGTQNFTVQFFNVLGQKISEPILIEANKTFSFDHTLSSGFYFVRCQWSGGGQTLRLIVR